MSVSLVSKAGALSGEHELSAERTLCDCGCGEPVNPLYDAARILRDERRMGFADIGRFLERSPKYIRLLLRNPPRYVKGHSARMAEYHTVICEACGKEFRTTTTSGRTFCTNSRYCSGSGVGRSGHRQFLKRYYQREDQQRRSVTRNAREELRRWKAEDRRRAEGRARESRRQVREFRKLRRRGERLPWQVDRAPEAERAPDEAQELEALIAQQEREMNRAASWAGERPKGSLSGWAPRSLDDRTKARDSDNQDGRGLEFHEYFTGQAGPSAEEEFFQVEREEQLREAIGDLSVEQAERLPEDTAAWLRDKLREAGLTSSAVQRKERERTRRPERHRGYSPPMTFQPVHSKRRSRKQQIVLMKGKRISRRPRKRWNREVVVYDWKAAA